MTTTPTTPDVTMAASTTPADQFERWLRSVCITKPPSDAHDLARCAFEFGRTLATQAAERVAVSGAVAYLRPAAASTRHRAWEVTDPDWPGCTPVYATPPQQATNPITCPSTSK